MVRAVTVAEQVTRWVPLIVLVAGAVALALPGAFSGWTVAVPWLLRA